MAETRQPSERYAAMAARVLEEEEGLRHVRESAARIAYLESDAKRARRGKTVLGTCEKVPAKWKWKVPYDFAITVFAPNVQGLSEAQLRTLLYHELLHVGVTVKEDGEEAYSIVPHDVEDFRAVVERGGLDWAVPAE